MMTILSHAPTPAPTKTPAQALTETLAPTENLTPMGNTANWLLSFELLGL